MAFTTLFHEVLLPDRLEYGMRLIAGEFGEEIAYTKSGYRSANVSWTEDLRQWSLSFNMETLNQAQDLLKFHQNRKGTAYGFRIFDHIDFQATDENFGRGGHGINEANTQFNLRKIYRDSAGQLSSSDISFANANSRITSATIGFFKDILADSFVFIDGASDNGNNGLFLVSSVNSAGTYFDVLEPDGSAASLTTQSAGAAITVDMFVTTKRIYKVMEGRFVDSDYLFSVSVNGTPTAVTLNENTGLITFSPAPADGAILTWSGGHHWPVAFKSKINLDYDRYNHLNLPDITVEEIKIFTS